MTAGTNPDKDLAGNIHPLRNGVFIAVAGPSGAGKDSLIDYCRTAFRREPDQNAVFPNRVVTRRCDPGAEIHDSLSSEQFDAADAGGAFAIAWEAHGLKYGLPVSIDSALQEGKVVVCNVSRGVIGRLRLRYANVIVVLIAAHPETLAKRMAARAREDATAIGLRLERAVQADIAGAAIILNDGPLSEGGERLAAIIRNACRAKEPVASAIK